MAEPVWAARGAGSQPRAATLQRSVIRAVRRGLADFPVRTMWLGDNRWSGLLWLGEALVGGLFDEQRYEFPEPVVVEVGVDAADDRGQRLGVDVGVGDG